MKKGFTLIELLITIAIIGILMSIGLYTYPNTQKLARDSRRKSDLKQYQTTLENYANKTSGLYPVHATSLTITASGGLCAELAIGTCTIDPTNTGVYLYKYVSDNSGTNYVLWARLESKTTATYWRVCSNGKTDEVTAEPTDTTCL